VPANGGLAVLVAGGCHRAGRMRRVRLPTGRQLGEEQRRGHYDKSGDLGTNRRDEQEMSVLCLRILQAAIVCVKTPCSGTCWPTRSGRTCSPRRTEAAGLARAIEQYFAPGTRRDAAVAGRWFEA
jgi:hypothetical protein